MSSESDSESETPTWQGAQGSIILVNIQDGTGDVALEATTQMIRYILRKSNSYLVGVCLYGTEDSNSSSFLKGVTEIFPLTNPTLDEYKKLTKAKSTSFNKSGDLILSDALCHCSKMFDSCKRKMSSSTILILSKLQRPPVEADKKPSLERVKIIVDSHVKIKLINISNEAYEIDPFYKNFQTEANKGSETDLPPPIWNTKEIQKVIFQQSHGHLAIARLNFQIGDGMEIGVGVYGLLMKSSDAHKKHNVDSDSNEIVTSVNKMLKVNVSNVQEPDIAKDSDGDVNRKAEQTSVKKSELLHYQIFGGEKVTFSDFEMSKIKNPFGLPTMKLLGFKPADIQCKEKWFIKTCNFIYPTENVIEGSTIVFRALHKACVEMKVVAICVLCTRVNSRPNIVALSPCSLPLGLDIELGFDVIYLPFVENVRDLPDFSVNEESRDITDAHKEVMTDILNSLKFDYKPDMFENPKLQTEYRIIEAKALGEDQLEHLTDTTKRDSKYFENIRADLFEEYFGPFEGESLKVSRDNTGNKSKSNDLDKKTIEEYIKYKTLHKCRVEQLKTILKDCNNPHVPKSKNLKKNELIELIYKYYTF